MPWVPLQESGIGYYFDTAVQQGSPVYILEGSSVKTNGTQVRNWWELGFDENVMLRLTVASEHPSGYLYIEFYWEGGNQDNKTPEPGQSFTPEVIEAGPTSYLGFTAGSSIVEGTLSVLLEVWEGDDPDPDALVANDDEATTPMSTPVTVDVLANDTFNDEPVSLSDLDGPPTIETQPQNGTVAVNADGTITYTPNPGFTGTDTFEYRITTPEPEPSCPEIWSSNGGFEMAELWSQIPAFGEFGGNGFYLINGSVSIAFWSSDGEYAYPDVGEDYPDCGHLGEWIMSWGDSTGEQCVIWENGCS